MNENDNMQSGDLKLNKDLTELDWDIQPSRDLWPDISSKIRFAEKRLDTQQQNDKPDQKKPWIPFAIAASSVLAVVSLVFSSLSYQYAQDAQKHQETLAMYQQAQLQLIDQQHQMVRMQFARLLENENNSLNPEFVLEVQNLMMNIDTASAEIKKAIAAQPNNPNFTSMLVDTYQRELKLLNKVKSKQGISI